MDPETINRAFALRKSGAMDEALRLFRGAAAGASDPNDRAGVMLHEASCLISLRRFDEAKTALQRAREATQDTWLGAYADQQEAVIYMWECRYEESLAVYDRLLATYPFIREDARFRALFESVQTERAILLSTLHFAAKALPALTDALSFNLSDPERGMVLYHLGRCFMTLKSFAKAKAAFEDLLKICQDRHCLLGARFSLGMIYAQQRIWGRALRDLRWCEQNCGDGDLPRRLLHEWLAKVLDATGSPAEAKRYRAMMDIVDVA